MSIRNLKRFYTAEDASSFVVYDSAATFASPDEETMSLTYESPKSTKSDLPRKKKAKRVRFWDDSGLTGFRSQFGYPPLKDRSVQWKDRGWTPRFMVRLWQERYRECPCVRGCVINGLADNCQYAAHIGRQLVGQAIYLYCYFL